jgi:hypothetical protein
MCCVFVWLVFALYLVSNVAGVSGLCSCLIDTSVFCSVYFKANKAIVATLFPLRISFVNDFTRLDVLDLNFLLLLMT